jgi:hypothetical protein
MQAEDLTKLRGIVATVVLTGSVMEEFSQCLGDMRAWAIEHGFVNVEWQQFSAQLVEHGRDAVIQHAKDNDYDFALMIDADAVFGADTLGKMLHSAFMRVPQSDALSAYAQLKHEPYLPVIDTGTGTWEPHFPGEGILQCMRVGGHCIMVKKSAWQKFGPSWFRTRKTLRPVDALREVDNYARINKHGENPLEGETWTDLMNKATEESGGVISAVGEDSGFCDALCAAGGLIYVDCNIVTGHVTKRTIKATDLRDALKDKEKRLAAAVGVLL